MLIDSYIGKGEVIKNSGTIGCGDGKGKIKITDRFVYIQEPDDNVFIRYTKDFQYEIGA